MKGNLLKDLVAHCLTMYSVTSSPSWIILNILIYLDVPSTFSPHVTTEFWQEEGIERWLFFFFKLSVKHYKHEEKQQGLTI